MILYLPPLVKGVSSYPRPFFYTKSIFFLAVIHLSPITQFGHFILYIKNLSFSPSNLICFTYFYIYFMLLDLHNIYYKKNLHIVIHILHRVFHRLYPPLSPYFRTYTPFYPQVSTLNGQRIFHSTNLHNIVSLHKIHTTCVWAFSLCIAPCCI